MDIVDLRCYTAGEVSLPNQAQEPKSRKRQQDDEQKFLGRNLSFGFVHRLND
jgi:hypothetical protein